MYKQRGKACDGYWKLSCRGWRHPAANPASHFRRRRVAHQRPGPKKLQRLSRLVWPLDYYPLLLFHVDSNDTTRDHLEHIMCNYGALGERLKGVGAHVVFLSPSSGRERTGRNGLILQVNNWLHGWCHRQDFYYYDCRTLSEEQGLLKRNRIHPTMWVKSAFANRLENLARRAVK